MDPEQSLKSGWKREVKNKIRKETEKIIRAKCEESTKSRTVLGGAYEVKEYYRTLPIKVSKEGLKYRLHMVNIPMNFKNSWSDLSCPLCMEERGSTEHFFTCTRTESLRAVWNVTNLEEETPSEMERIARYFGDVQTLVHPKWVKQKEIVEGA